MKASIMYVSYTEDALPVDEQRPGAVTLLRTRLRDAAHSLVEDSVSHGDVEPVLIAADLTWRPVARGDANGVAVEWCAIGEPWVSDASVPVVDVDQAGDVAMPEPVTVGNITAVRVAHGYGGEVTVTAFSADGPTGYLFASPVDDDTLHVEVMPGTVRLHVELDPMEEP